jgi:NADP-dependent 3-hydroxy acid dehydrogenase YdfG
MDVLANNARRYLSSNAAVQAYFVNMDTMVDTDINSLMYYARATPSDMVARGARYVASIGSIVASLSYPGRRLGLCGSVCAAVIKKLLNWLSGERYTRLLSRPDCALGEVLGGSV